MVTKKISPFLLWDRSDINKIIEFFIENRGKKFHKTQIREETGVTIRKKGDKLGSILKKLVKYKILIMTNKNGQIFYELNYKINNRLLNRYIDFRKAFNELHRRMHK